MAVGTLDMADQKTNKAPIKVERDLYKKLSLIALMTDRSIAEIASDMLRPYVEQEYLQALEKLDQERKRKKK